MAAALLWARNGSTTDPRVARIALRRAFWTNFGADIDAAWRAWPEREFRDALSVLEAEAKASRQSSSAPPEQTKRTQETWDSLPRITREEQQRQIAEAARGAG